MNNLSLKPLNISTGTYPDADQQVSNPRLLNGFVNREENIELLPNLKKLFSFNNLRAIHQSIFKNRIIVATQSEIFYIENESVNKIGEIISTINAVRIDENVQAQVTIVNGAGAWVFDQNANSFNKLSSAINEFDIENPVDVVVLNTFTIIVGGTDKKWIVSNANNALNYAANEVRETDNSLGELTGCEHWNNNLFIFGTGGVQRWIPSIERTTTDFPFSQDPTYRDEFGCVSTASLISDNNQLFYLSDNGQVRYMSAAGTQTITNDGIERIISNYESPNAFGSYYYTQGHYLYVLSFPEDNNTFVFCPGTKKWSETDQLWLGFAQNVGLKDGVYQLTDDFEDGKKVIIQTSYIYPKPNNLEMRALLSCVLLQITQGKSTTPKRQTCFLQLSKDNVLFSNKIGVNLSKTAERLFQMRWHMNYSNTGVTFRFTFELFSDVTIERAFVRFF